MAQASPAQLGAVPGDAVFNDSLFISVNIVTVPVQHTSLNVDLAVVLIDGFLDGLGDVFGGNLALAVGGHAVLQRTRTIILQEQMVLSGVVLGGIAALGVKPHSPGRPGRW